MKTEYGTDNKIKEKRYLSWKTRQTQRHRTQRLITSH